LEKIANKIKLEYLKYNIMEVNMSVEVITYEKLHIKDLNKCKKFKDVLVNYLSNLCENANSMNVDIHLIDIKVDKEHIRLEQENIIPGCLENILLEVEDSKILELESSYTAQAFGLNKVGFNFYKEFLTDNLKDIVNYKVLEYYDVDSEVVAYRFGKENGKYYDGYINLVRGIKDVCHIKEWYCYNFNIEFELEAVNKNSIEKIQKTLKDLEKITDYEFEIDEEENINYSMFCTLNEFNIHKFDKLIELINNIKGFVEEKDGTFEFEGQFTPETERIFSKIAILEDNNKYELFSCRY
jgi:hypothetical protein